jgi:peptide/nickel transport system substrate-binding protein
MNSRIVWVILGCLLIAALVLGSCAPAAVEEEGKTIVGKVVEKEVVVKEEAKKEVAPTVEGPKYGGVFTGGWASYPGIFDDAWGFGTNCYFLHLTHDELLVGDWAKGPTGSGEASFLIRGTFFPKLETGSIAESWELVDDQTIVYQIRKGVYFQDKPPVNGREMNADDVVFSIKRHFETPQSYVYQNYFKIFQSVEAKDKWTVEVKSTPGTVGTMFILTAEYVKIVPHEVVDLYGSMKDWHNVVGTGAFILKDYVQDSSGTLVRNPNYFATDPLHPQNRLPYLDGVKWLIIPDLSTRLAGIRVGKIDNDILGWEDTKSLLESNPELKYYKWLQAAHLNIIWMRTDKPELPIADVRVRRALSMALDRQVIIDSYYDHQAEIFSTPVAPYPELMDIFVPLEEMPESVRENYSYNPDKAKALLAEAGYPNGFKTEIICWQNQVDILSLVKESWAKIGVDLNLDVREYAVYNSTLMLRSHKEMAFAYLSSVAPHVMLNFMPTFFQDWAMVDDARVKEAYEIVRKNVVVNEPEANRALREVYPYILEQAWYVETPAPYNFTVWQPWVKGYNGEFTVGYSQPYNYPIWLWYDVALKEKMTGKK